ncbi:MAG TPA: 4'-phosphopantetheinyl transferase superfamily protein [Kofleriaceae bacterium]|nr:4'-phosphopantetheinyl transferase superfamily protein [Kofleriaceae bacterium]
MTTTLAIPHGTCVLVELADDAACDAALARLPAAEQAHARSLSAVRRRELVAGRTALHIALDDFATPILADDRGAPILPPGWSGSASHKGTLAAGLVAPAGEGHVGIDLELAAPPRVDIARRILTPREQARLPDRGRAVTLRFAIKEAIYKAVAPTLRRYVGFLEVELDLDADHCRVSSALPFARIEAAWREHAGYWLASARAVPL